jgi:hypothetical protein
LPKWPSVAWRRRIALLRSRIVKTRTASCTAAVQHLWCAHCVDGTCLRHADPQCRIKSTPATASADVLFSLHEAPVLACVGGRRGLCGWTKPHDHVLARHTHLRCHVTCGRLTNNGIHFLKEAVQVQPFMCSCRPGIQGTDPQLSCGKAQRCIDSVCDQLHTGVS